MLSVTSMAISRAGEYYLALAADDDYYPSGKNPAGVYWGKGAEKLAVSGEDGNGIGARTFKPSRET